MRWTWSLLFALVLTILVIEVTGFFLPEQTDVERAGEVGASREEVFALVGDLRRWPEWAPLLRDPEGKPFVPQFMGEERGLGAQMLVRYQGDNQVLFTVVEFEPPERLSINTRTGRAGDDLLAGDGFEAWDDLTVESLSSDRSRVTWRRRGGVVESYWIRFLDRFVLRGRLEESLTEQLDALAAQLD
ncbi:MAG: SRPBCC family protein [Planctomycetota bacterium]